MTNQITGTCLCKAVTIEAKTETDAVDTCHCKNCQTWGGGPLFTLKADTNINFDGEASITVYDSSDWAQRGFCKHCGSHLFYRLKDGPKYFLPAGLFQDDQQRVFEQEIFIDQKPHYYHFAEETKKLTGEQVFALFAAQSE